MTAGKCPGCGEGDGPCTCYASGRAQALADFRASIDGQHAKDCTCPPCLLMRILNLDPAEVRTWDLKLDEYKRHLNGNRFQGNRQRRETQAQDAGRRAPRPGESTGRGAFAVEVADLDQGDAKDILREFIQHNPQEWNRDIGR